MNRTLLPMGVGLALAVAFATSACGDDDETAAPAPLPPPTLSIVSVQGVGGPLWEPGKDPCVELGLDADQSVVVSFVATDFVLRPPGTCGSARQCGTALLRVDPSGDSDAQHVQAAQTSITAKLAELGAGSHTFRVELRDKNGEPVPDAEAGGTLASEVTLEVKAPGGCSGVTDAGSDAATDAGSDAGDAASDASDGGDAGEIGRAHV